MRKIILANNEIYHVFNRGVEKRTTFTDKREYQRALSAIDFYRFKKSPLSLGQVLNLSIEKRELFFAQLKMNSKKLVDILCFCLMPNHFHLLLKQNENDGIKIFLSNFTNSYTRYFNTKNDRVGPLFQGTFKSVRIEDDEQLMHVSRYIHLNPVAFFVTKKENLENYPWSSFEEYISKEKANIICETKPVLELFSSANKYKEFVLNQFDYAKKLEEIKHLILE